MLSLKNILRALTCTLLVLILPFSASALPKSQKAESMLAPPSISASSAVLIDADTKSILYQKDAHTRRAMASTTKIMTALVAAELCELDRVVSVNEGAVGVEGSSVYLYANERLTMYELLCAMLLESANDAAAAIAFEVGGSIEGFCDLMNQKAKALGLSDTHFTNPHGLYDTEHYTTAYELALIGAAALENEDIRKIVSTKKMTIGAAGTTERVLYNHNKMLSSYEGAIGLKTGFTKKSGRCLVSAAAREGLVLIAVTLGAPDDWNDHRSMLDFGFDNFECATLAKKGEVAYRLGVMGGNETQVSLVFANSLSVTLPRGALSRVECITETFTRNEFAPLPSGKSLGVASFYFDGKKIAEAELVSATEVKRIPSKNGFFHKLKNIFK